MIKNYNFIYIYNNNNGQKSKFINFIGQTVKNSFSMIIRLIVWQFYAIKIKLINHTNINCMLVFYSSYFE